MHGAAGAALLWLIWRAASLHSPWMLQGLCRYPALILVLHQEALHEAMKSLAVHWSLQQ
jgi:hypothetical protein